MNGPIDYVYYISPSIASDLTLKRDGKKILIEGSKQVILELVDQIFRMRDDLYSVLQIQLDLRHILKNKLITSFIKDL